MLIRVCGYGRRCNGAALSEVAATRVAHAMRMILKSRLGDDDIEKGSQTMNLSNEISCEN